MKTEQIKKPIGQNLKYCIWDVGKVIYDYNLNALNDLMSSLTKNPEAFKAQKGVFKFDYDDYMKGLVSFDELCRLLCAYCGVDSSNLSELNSQIAQAFHMGIKGYFPQTLEMMEFMRAHGIQNCVLSNALPVLGETLNTGELISKENVFTSYELGLLKPDTQIYQAVIQRLGVKPSELIFIDDKQENVDGAIACEIYAIVYHQETIINELTQLF